MSLPSLIEIQPVAGPLSGPVTVTVPGSKSLTNRALVLAALGDGATTLRGALWSEDTQVMTDCLRRLGFEVAVEIDPEEEANRSITVRGLGGRIPRAGTAEAPLELYVGNAGTAARFLAAMVCLGSGVFRLSGVPRMHDRPQAELFGALRSLGYRIDSATDRLPAVIHGTGPRRGRGQVSADASSQFASALLLSARVGGWEIEVVGGDEEELPYVQMTRRLVEVFPVHGGVFEIEADASSGSYFWAAGRLLAADPAAGPVVRVRRWPTTGWQVDEAFPRYLGPRAAISRQTDLGDSIMTAIVLAPFGSAPCRFTDLGRLRLQECERVVALRTELTRCGARVEESGDTLTVWPSQLRGAEIETYEDHRMAMCFAVVGLKVPGIRLKDPGCVRKTFPNFFAKLALSAPAGVGARIVCPRSGEVMSGERLLADPT
ncbi:MAG: 3-phosphoshikimate 1-carboxyvinyltransferase [Verrucomicrobiales bacterium]|nr:3-phosphoshikimate 1-carboxyvinyltransferase [Verrucomicrobiales bacterium]